MLILDERGAAWTYAVRPWWMVYGVGGLWENVMDYMRSGCMVYDLDILSWAWALYVRSL